jgi:hypothetical protein
MKNNSPWLFQIKLQEPVLFADFSVSRLLNWLISVWRISYWFCSFFYPRMWSLKMKGEDITTASLRYMAGVAIVFGVAISPLWFCGLLSSVFAYNAEVSSETLHKGFLYNACCIFGICRLLFYLQSKWYFCIL